MFYSETLLSKTGPLARVWLAANIERKLSKTNILQQDIGSSVNAIVDQGQAPLALRLSGQLLLGVVRIYSRKARYLLDDCNDALLKIKMAFKPGNVDLPLNHSHAANPNALMLQDTLTIEDIMAPMDDPSLLLTQLPELDENRHDPTLLEPNASQFLPGSIESRHADQDDGQLLDEIDLGLDIGPDPAPDANTSIDMSIERARRQSTSRAPQDEFGDDMRNWDDDLGLDFGFDDEPAGRPSLSALPKIGGQSIGPVDEDIPMIGMDDELQLPLGENDAEATAPPPGQRDRDSLSPLSSIRPSEERDLEASFQAANETTIASDDRDISLVQAPQRARKRQKTLQADTELELRLSEIKNQQLNHAKILKAPSFLPRDPVLLTLMNMQQNGGFVSNILGDGRAQGWAPELRGVLSLELVRKSGELKRKRDSGVADMDEDGDATVGANQSLQLDIPQDETDFAIGDGGAVQPPSTRKSARFAEPEQLYRIEDEGFVAPGDDSFPPLEDEGIAPPPEDFDETTIPILHPADAGPISVGTKHAVHLYRAQFTAQQPNAASSPTARQKSSILFQDLLPEKKTTKTDATKMFFETLVLATKDAVKVEQGSDALGGRIRIRAKRGLWGAWAEEKAGGEIAAQEEEGAEPVAGAA
ncbi:MAG: sister chromatid cohesion protein 1 [Bogoriella megaspora]|nr:MAG: sister chromatid cohesion protein 1 [Bogoriella megaspora]